jgi:N-acetylglucosaminyldiphosphoundecaprenol N-acetyl-beta-D-mannosaminyltransferase
VNAFQPEVLFVGMTAPKQEKWAYQFHSALEVRITCCIGAVFDFYAGTMRRPSQLWINLGLEWFGRLISEPKRLWRRYLYYGPIFIYGMIKEKIKTES